MSCDNLFAALPVCSSPALANILALSLGHVLADQSLAGRAGGAGGGGSSESLASCLSVLTQLSGLHSLAVFIAGDSQQLGRWATGAGNVNSSGLVA